MIRLRYYFLTTIQINEMSVVVGVLIVISLAFDPIILPWFLFTMIMHVRSVKKRARRASSTFSGSGQQISFQLTPRFGSNVRLVKLISTSNCRPGGAELYKAVWNGNYYCVKLFDTGSKFQEEKAILEMPLLKHENIVMYYFDDVIPCRGEILVFKYYENGDLEQYLRKHWHSIPFNIGSGMCVGIIKGLNFLHSPLQSSTLTKPAIAHGDLSPKNILIKDDLTCVLADFEKSVVEGRVQNKTTFGTKRYLPVEMLDGSFENSFGSYCEGEIYTFALIAYEIMICMNGMGDGVLQPPIFSGILSRNPTLQEVRDVVVGKRPKIPAMWETCCPDIVQLLKSCWLKDPKKRPSSMELLNKIDLIVHQVM